MIQIIIALLGYIGVYYFLYKHLIDAIEFTCIDYDEFLDPIEKPRAATPIYEDKYKSDMGTNQIVVNERDIDDRFDSLMKQAISEITDKINRELVSYEWDWIKATEKSNEHKQRAYFINDKMEQMKTELYARMLVKDDILELAESQLIQERLENLRHSFVMEHTPVGNVVMYYNHTKEAFEYYSDNVVPYRYLDTVCRKYVITNLCVPLYVDINEELKKFRERVQEDEERKSEQEPVSKPSVFVKLKNYKQPIVKTAKTYVKARTNKYLYQGRMNNFHFTKPLVSKQETMSFAEYKKMLLYVAD